MNLLTVKSRRRFLALGVAALILAGGVGGAFWYDRSWPWHHFRTVVAGRLYRAGQPSADNVRTAVADYGVRTIVNLRSVAERDGADWHAVEVRATHEAGAVHVDVPISPSAPPSPAQVDQLLQIFGDPARAPVLVHCEAGSVRSAAVEGLYRIEVMGETNAEALARVERWGHDLAAKEPAIHAFLRDYVPKRARAPAAGR
jgi:protein tyrosine phosphatase (PTP) superfamily phosphohydrolase (DUF442 family)